MVYRPTARVLSVLELLQTHGQLTGIELARRLEVDSRTVRRYVVTLQDMGVPIDSEPGRYGGYALRPGYKLPPLMFTDDEVLMLTLGLMMARRSGVAGAGVAVESALAKIERVLPVGLRERLRALQEVMHVEDDLQSEPPVDANLVGMLTMASRNGVQVRLTYGDTVRVIDPYGVVNHQGRWYAVAYCHLREGMRVFRLDRAQVAELLESSFEPPADFDPVAYMLSSFEAIPDLWDVEVRLKMPVDDVRRMIPRAYATLTPDGDGTRLRASIDDLDVMARELIRLGCPMEIVSPQELRETFLRIAEEITGIARF
jgi:predicted DNA-binding transcriptional regulator YafY